MISSEAFHMCMQLMNVELCKGLEQIGNGAIEACTSLECIQIPSSVKMIDSEAFHLCTQLMNVELCEGLEWIQDGAFQACTSLECIQIPSTVKMIWKNALLECDNKVRVEFSAEIERLVTSLSLQVWWNDGILKISWECLIIWINLRGDWAWSIGYGNLVFKACSWALFWLPMTNWMMNSTLSMPSFLFLKDCRPHICPFLSCNWRSYSGKAMQH